MRAETGTRARRPAGPGLISKVGIILVGIVFFFPFIWMFASSLKPSLEVFSSGGSLLGSRLEWSNYSSVWTAVPFARILVNSFLVAAAGALLAVTVSLLSAYAFSRLQFRYRDRLFLVFLGTLVLPQEVLVIPLYIMASRAQMVDTYAALILPFAFGAFGAFMLRQFLLTLPRDYEEAARIDGAGQLRILVHVIAPLLRAPLAVVGAFLFIEYWNSFLWPLIVINDQDMATLPLGLQMFSGERGTDWGPLMAAATLAVVPSLLIVVAMQKQLANGVNLGGFGGR
ncbi:carbohydrate ABC transporter permease [Georgenia halophila]|uniref:Carbohydrate ABC transporter permease n=1 Tax=Georgenia halophila TaxID=620889 RepID=A0ABP8LL11_9MICO